MVRCNKCNVSVETGLPRCPLCFAALENDGESDVSYPDYTTAYQEDKRFTVKKLFLFLSAVLGILCLVVNLLTWEISGYLWSMIVIVLMIILWCFMLTIRSKRINMAGRILMLYALIVAVLLAVDGGDEFRGWSTTYVLPFLTMAVVLVMTVMAVSEKKRYKDYLGHLIATLIISVCPFLLFLFSLSITLWPSIATLTYSLLTVVGLYIFSDREFKMEVKKRFHF